mgnify:CR=1 FL=1
MEMPWRWPSLLHEKLTEFMELIPNMLPDTRSYKGCESVQVNVEQNTSTVFMVEVWGSRPDYEIGRAHV